MKKYDFLLACLVGVMAGMTWYFGKYLFEPVPVESAQPVTVIVYPQADGVTCYGAPEPFSCVYIPLVLTSTDLPPRPATATPLPSLTPTASPTRTLAPTSTATQAPTLTPTAIPPLLVNGDFEQPGHAGWTVFHLWEHQPTVNDERGHPDSRTNGAQSLRFFNESRCWLSGVYQQVNVQQFKTYVFSIHGRTWASYTSAFPSPSDLNVTDGVAVGIDPSGGTNPLSTGIVWVEASNTEVWRLVEVQATALASKITVFVRARLGAIPPSACQWSLPFMLAFVDDARLAPAP